MSIKVYMNSYSINILDLIEQFSNNYECMYSKRARSGLIKFSQFPLNNQIYMIWILELSCWNTTHSQLINYHSNNDKRDSNQLFDQVEEGHNENFHINYIRRKSLYFCDNLDFTIIGFLRSWSYMYTHLSLMINFSSPITPFNYIFFSIC